MAQITDIMKLDSIEQHALVIRVKTRPQDFSGILQQSRKAIRAYLKEIGEIPSGVTFVGFYSYDDSQIDAVVGFPVKKALEPKGQIELFVIPEGLRVNAFHQGPYDGMAQTYSKLEDWVKDNGYEIVLPAYEYFYNTPKYPQELLLTKIEMVIAAKKPEA